MHLLRLGLFINLCVYILINLKICVDDFISTIFFYKRHDHEIGLACITFWLMSGKIDISSCTDCHQSLYTIVFRTIVYRNRQLVLHSSVHFKNIGAHNEHHERRDAFCNCYILAVHKIERVIRSHSARPMRSQITSVQEVKRPLTLVFMQNMNGFTRSVTATF